MKTADKKGITFIPLNEITEEARLKLKRMAESKKENLKKVISEFNEGKLNFQ